MNATLHPPPDRRLAALALTVLVHALLLLGWLGTRRLPPLPAATADTARIQWIDLTPRTPALPRPTPAQMPDHVPARAPERTPARSRAPAREAAPAMVLVPAAPAQPADAGAAGPAPAMPSPAPTRADPRSAPLVQGALHAVAGIDRVLRKENNPYIVAPPDSPEIRMRRGMQAAHDMAPAKLWEAPQMDELANPSGNGERHTRVRGAFGTYCIANRSVGMSMAQHPTESGSQLHTSNCLSGEDTAAPQEWKTARDGGP